MSFTSKEFRLIEATLMSDASVEECVVRMRTDGEGTTRLVAYVVPTGAFVIEPLRAREKDLPKQLRPFAYIPVSVLPLRNDGTLDQEKLDSFGVVDEQVIERWERELKGTQQFGSVAFLLEGNVPEHLPWHLSDIVREQRTNKVQMAVQPSTPGRKESDRTDMAGKKLAITYGEPITLQVLPTLPDALTRAIVRRPDYGITYVQADGSEFQQTYSQLLADAERILSGLRKLGVSAGDKLIFQFDANQDFISAFWACQLGGFVPVPVAIAPSYRESNAGIQKLHNAWIMLDHAPILTGSRLLSELQSISQSMDMPDMRVLNIEELRKNERDSKWHKSKADDVALILLTSGSTGMPKGVMLRHCNFLSRSAGTAQMNELTDNEISLNWFPLDHVGGIVMFHVMDLCLCARQIQVPTASVLEDPLKWLDLVHKHRVSVSWAPNFAFGLINDRAEEIRASKSWDLSCLDFVLNGGEAIVAKTAARFMEVLAPFGLPSTAMHPAWGMSETSSGIAFSDHFDVSKAGASLVEVGAAIPGAAMRIVDGQDHVVEEGKIGRLQASGATITAGYYNNMKLSEESFSRDGWLNTGDLAFLLDGQLTITGRSKDVIIVNGVNYYSHEIEAAVEEVEGVDISFTAACPVRVSGSNTDKLAIFFHPLESDWEFKLDLLRKIREVVVRNIGLNPDYLIPVERQDVPKTGIGKIQHSQMRERFEAGEFAETLKGIDIRLGNANTLPNWFFQRTWKRKDLIASESPLQGTLLLFAEHKGVEVLQKFAASSGARAVTVQTGTVFHEIGANSFQIDPHNSEDYRKLLNTIGADGSRPCHIIHAWNFGNSAGIGSIDELRESQYRGTYSLLYLAQALLSEPGNNQNIRMLVLTDCAQRVNDGDVISPERATLIGILQTMSLENPRFECRHLDCSGLDWEAVAPLALSEIAAIKGKAEVAYRDGWRYVAALSRINMVAGGTDESAIRRGGLYMVTGGLGGIGTKLCQLLAARYQARVLIVGRTDLGSRGDWANLLELDTPKAARIRSLLALESAGLQVLYRQADVADTGALQQAILGAEAYWQQPLDGVFHLAGELHFEEHWKTMDQHWIASESLKAFERMFHAKVYGTWTLRQLLADRPSLLFVAFSSVNGIFGGATFSAYSAANSFVDACMQAREIGRIYTFSWTMWDGLGMSWNSPEYAREASRTMGYRILEKEQGFDSLLAGLHRNPSQVIVGLDSNTPRIRRHILDECYPLRKAVGYFSTSQTAASEPLRFVDKLGYEITPELVRVESIPLTESGEIDRERLESGTTASITATVYVAPRTEVEKKVADIWREVLGVPRVSMTDRFFELGGDSLTAMRLVNRLRKSFCADVSLRSLFQMPTVSEIAAVISEGNKAAELVKTAAASGSIPDHITQQVAGMTDDQVDIALRDLVKRQG